LPAAVMFQVGFTTGKCVSACSSNFTPQVHEARNQSQIYYSQSI